MPEKTNKWVTQKEAAELSGRSLESINQLVRNNRIKTKSLYGKRLVNSTEIINYKHIKPGRPRTK